MDSFRSSTVFYNEDGQKTMQTNTNTAIPIAYVGGYSNETAPCNPAAGTNENAGGGNGGFCAGGSSGLLPLLGGGSANLIPDPTPNDNWRSPNEVLGAGCYAYMRTLGFYLGEGDAPPPLGHADEVNTTTYDMLFSLCGIQTPNGSVCDPVTGLPLTGLCAFEKAAREACPEICGRCCASSDQDPWSGNGAEDDGGNGGCPPCLCPNCTPGLYCTGLCSEDGDAAGSAESWNLQVGLIAPSTITTTTPFKVQIKKSQTFTKSVYITPGICVDMLCPDCNSYESC